MDGGFNMCHTAAAEEYFGFQLDDRGEATKVAEEPQRLLAPGKSREALAWAKQLSPCYTY